MMLYSLDTAESTCHSTDGHTKTQQLSAPTPPRVACRHNEPLPTPHSPSYLLVSCPCDVRCLTPTPPQTFMCVGSCFFFFLSSDGRGASAYPTQPVHITALTPRYTAV